MKQEIVHFDQNADGLPQVGLPCGHLVEFEDVARFVDCIARNVKKC